MNKTFLKRNYKPSKEKRVEQMKKLKEKENEMVCKNKEHEFDNLGYCSTCGKPHMDYYNIEKLA
jgi:hypothetical protein